MPTTFVRTSTGRGEGVKVLLGFSTAEKVVYWTASVVGGGYRIVNEAWIVDSEIVVVMKVVAVAP